MTTHLSPVWRLLFLETVAFPNSAFRPLILETLFSLQVNYSDYTWTFQIKYKRFECSDLGVREIKQTQKRML